MRIEDERFALVLWAGAGAHVIESVGHLADILEPYAILDAVTRQQLRAEQQQANPPTRLQQCLRDQLRTR